MYDLRPSVTLYVVCVPEGHGILAGGATTGLIGQSDCAPAGAQDEAWRAMCHQLI
jgi:hypothetical protein